jgi:predicted glutamine amidotransferase
MCRFILLASPEPYDMRELAVQFAHMCQQSKCLDGDWQGDGWGMAWQDHEGAWQRHRSLAPIWTDADALADLPPTHHLIIHARAASFPYQKGHLSYNQPYVHGSHAFVFNGLIKGVRLPRKVPGSIGAAKIWWLVREQLDQGTPLQQALDHVYDLLAEHSSRIQACNMGLSNGREYVFCNGNPGGLDYYQIYQAQQDALHMASSEPFGDYAWHTS